MSDFIDRLKGMFNIDSESLARVFKLVKQIGIYESVKVLMKQPFFRNAVKSKLEELHTALVNKYNITSESIIHVEEGDKVKVVAELEIADPELRKEFQDRLRDLVRNIFGGEYGLVPEFVKEFEIESISCKERGDKVFVYVVGGKKLIELLKVGGVENVGEEEG
ncbi:MAG: hypothetical protein ACXQS2_01855 [Methermicoccaceae archaeon]